MAKFNQIILGLKVLNFQSSKKYLRILKNIFFITNKNSIRFIKHNYKVWKNENVKKSKNLLLIDYFESHESELLRSYFCNIYAKKHDCKVVVFSLGKRLLINREWRKIYKSFNVKKFICIFYSSFYLDLFFNFKKKKLFKNNLNELLKNIKTKQDVINIKYKNIEIGREIYAEYLYRLRKPTVDLKDQKLKDIIYEGIVLIEYWIDFFKKNNVKAITLSHPNTRFLALSGKVANHFFSIPVFAVNHRYIYSHLNLNNHRDWIREHLLEIPNYFKKINSNQKIDGIQWAQKRLESRLKGVVGVDMNYSTDSAFHNNFSNPVIKKNDKIKILIGTHEFYDDPQATGGLLFSDFYEWLVFLGEQSKKFNYDWYLKNHPDTDPWTVQVINDLLKKYPNIKQVDGKISWLQLKNEGINFVFTCHGTIGHECPLLDMQVINADINHPHIAYDFNWTPKTIDEYENMIKDLPNMKKKINKNDVYEYYYVVHKLLEKDDIMFKSYKLTKKLEIKKSKNFVDMFLVEFSNERHMKIKENIDKLISRNYKNK